MPNSTKVKASPRRTRPDGATVRLVAIGDSVVWGQGNREATKIAGRVGAALGLGAPLVVAHSGACIQSKKTVTADWGEVPLDAPVIFDQIDRAATQMRDVGDVRVVLLNGGINDVPVTSIISGEEGDLKDRITKAFKKPFPALLTKAVETFPAATVVALGYYPIVSEASRASACARALVYLGPKGVAKRAAKALESAEGDEHRLGRALANELSSMGELSRIFAESANAFVQSAVTSRVDRAVFAVPTWRAENSLGAKKTWLWSGFDDPLFGERVERFLLHVLQGELDWPLTTVVASLGHPNLAGSDAYAKAIVAAVKGRGRVASRGR